MDKLLKKVEAGESLSIEGLWDAPKAFLTTKIFEATKKPIVIVTSGQRSRRLYDDFAYFSNAPVREFPMWEETPDVVGERLGFLLKAGEPAIVLAPIQAIERKVLSRKELLDQCLTLVVGDEIDFSLLVEKLEMLGFERRPIAVEKGEFAVRGGLIDLFPVDSTDPFRVEFWGDAIDAIRLYDPIGQKSVGKAERVVLMPVEEEEGRASVLDYFDDAILILDETDDIDCSLQKIYWGQGDAPKWKHPFLPVTDLVESLESVVDRGLSLHFVCDSHSEEEKLRAMIKESRLILPKDTKFERGYLSSGFVLDPEAIIPMTEFTHRYKVRRQKMRSTTHTTPIDYLELKPGDYVVHYHSGVAKYLGTERRPNHEGELTEFLVLEYASAGRLFVPITKSHLLTKFIGAGEERPQLSVLGTGRWERLRVKTERAIRDYAAEMLKLHAEREIAEGFSFGEDGELVKEFDGDFPYEETGDQLKAIADVKKDMKASQPMDRLICGDVGYGKTEVAMRAAFKAVVDGGKQVAILVPTTVLAMQHWETFSERMANFPLNIEVLCRFRTPKQQKETLKKLAEGSVDILVGTHRIISKDVKFQNVGLIIIDEEQKFGVRVKEKLRGFKAGVDCLTLTATPIPRTLYLSLMGARDLSAISTPPQDRLPIQSVIEETDPELIKKALQRELDREGQSYVIHNRVETINQVAKKIQELVPDARVVVGHGQMSGNALDEVFHAFKKGEADILVATTIVENGVDIPNANTIIIERADTFGLADLYQLRGRVGRWNRRAYAYFLTPRDREILEISQKRLQALLEIGGYGGGMRLAMRDLELRGAGSILGTEQSGHVSAVGFHLYCKMLTRTIAQLKGEVPALAVDTKLDFPHEGRLPDTYINEPSLRMEIYQRFGQAADEADIDTLMEEVRDRFGRPPEPVLWLYHMMRIRIFASRKGIKELKLKKATLVADGKSCLIGRITDPKSLEKLVLTALSRLP